MDLKTTGAAAQLRLTAEEVSADDETLIYVDIAAVDADGLVCDAEKLTLQARVDGDAALLGFGSSNPKPVYNYITDTTETFYGRALLILKRTGSRAVDVTVTAKEQQGTAALRIEAV
ncbi:MAG: hypothetical protein LUD53_05535 [Clostridiales bacterium]|nr:hypothetical protein [Clostridiales bacterium]